MITPPRISAFYRDHAPPHFHAVYGEHEATIVIANFSVLSGDLPGRALRLVQEWARLHRFSDGSIREIDLEPESWGPVFEPLREPDEFRKVAVDHELGTIVWPTGADLDPDVLHGDRSPVDPPAATAT